MVAAGGIAGREGTGLAAAAGPFLEGTATAAAAWGDSLEGAATVVARLRRAVAATVAAVAHTSYLAGMGMAAVDSASGAPCLEGMDSAAVGQVPAGMASGVDRALHRNHGSC